MTKKAEIWTQQVSRIVARNVRRLGSGRPSQYLRRAAALRGGALITSLLHKVAQEPA